MTKRTNNQNETPAPSGATTTPRERAAAAAGFAPVLAAFVPTPAPTKRAKAGKKPTRPCGCGCGVTTKPGRWFLPGHDAKVAALFRRVISGDVTALEDAVAASEREAITRSEYLRGKAREAGILS